MPDNQDLEAQIARIKQALADLSSDDTLNKLASSFENMNTSASKTAQTIEKVRSAYANLTGTSSQIGKISSGMNAAGKSASSFGTIFSQITPIFSKFGLTADAVVRNVKSAVSELKEIDTILTEINKTGNITAAQLETLANSSFDTASKYGDTVTNFLSTVQEMYQAGYENAEQMAELSTLAQNAAGLDASLANDYLIASDAAYEYGGNIEKLTALLDSQNQVTSRHAVSLEELATATKVSVSQLSDANIAENEMTALLGTGIATTREDAETVGRAVRGIIMTLQQVEGETGFGTEVIDAEALSAVEERCHSLGIELTSLQDGMVRLRDPIAILEELAEVYNSLPDDSLEKSAIISDIGGKYRGNVLSSILSNWEEYERILKDYNNAEGSAMGAAMLSANNWEGSLNKLSNTWTSTIGNIAESDDMVTIINGLNGLLTVVGTVTEKLGLLGTLGVGAGLFAGFKNVGMTNYISSHQNHEIVLNVPTV